MYKIINWELADHAQITLINQKTNKVVAHFLIDNDYHLKLQEATFICNTLNKALQASDNKSKLLLGDVSVSVCGKGNWDCIYEKDDKCKYDGKCTARKTER